MTLQALSACSMQFVYARTGGQLSQTHVDSGQQIAFDDAQGRNWLSMDARGTLGRQVYDPLGRPIRQDIKRSDQDLEFLTVERTTYLDSAGAAANLNLVGRAFTELGQGDWRLYPAYSISGQPLAEAERLLKLPIMNTPDADAALPIRDLPSPGPDGTLPESFTALGTNTFTWLYQYDGPERPIAASDPSGALTVTTYQQGRLPDRVTHNDAVMLTGFKVDARGRLLGFEQGQSPDAPSGTALLATGYRYRHDEIAAEQIYDTRNTAHIAATGPEYNWIGSATDPDRIQELQLTRDPQGNVTSVRDAFRQLIFGETDAAMAERTYQHDARNRMIKATGLEQVDATPRDNLSAPIADGIQAWTEDYFHDDGGNLSEIRHSVAGVRAPGNEAFFVRSKQSNRAIAKVDLAALGLITSEPELDEQEFVALNLFDANGNQLTGRGGQSFTWTWQNQIGRLHYPDPENPTLTVVETSLYDRAGGHRLQHAREVFDQDGQRLHVSLRRAFNTVLSHLEAHVATEDSALSFDGETVTGGDRLFSDWESRILIGHKQCARIITDLISTQQVIYHSVTDQIDSVTHEIDETAASIAFQAYYPYGNIAISAQRGVEPS